MEKYSDTVLQEIKDRVSTWVDEFEESTEYSGLSAAEREESGFIIDVFAELMYNYFLETPEKWSAGALAECCLDLFPRKVLSGPEFYEAVEPVLTAFFAFLQRNGRITNAAELTRRLRKVAGDMIRRANQPDNWGLAKTVFVGALRDGVDLSDETALARYVEKWNEQGYPRTAGVEGPRRVGRKVGRNEPCPCGSGKKYKKCCGAPVKATDSPDTTGATPD